MTSYTATRKGNTVTVYVQAIPDVGPDAGRDDLSSHPRSVVAVFEGPPGHIRQVSGKTGIGQIVEAAYSV